MTFLYESNIGSSLSLKSAVDIITERLMSANETGSQGDYNGPVPFLTRQDLYTLRNNTVFNKVLANVFQNIKTDGLDCKTFVNRINSFVNKSIKSSFKKTDIQLAINAIDNLYVTIYKDSDDTLKKNTFYIQKNLNDVGLYAQSDDINMSGIENLVKNNGSQNFINVKKESSFDHPHMFVTMINSPNIRASLQNELEMHTFLNSYNSLEFSKCIPYVDIKMKSPRYNKTYETRFRSNSNIASFLYPDEPYVGLTRGHLLNKHETASNKKDVLEEIHIGTFSMPQTAVNLNSRFGLIENNSVVNEDFIVPHDLTRPFMTINKLDLSVDAAAGLIAYKSGTLSLVLHDRTRMKQVAGFLDPSLQGLHGPNITIEFGWSHPSEPGNILGKFLNESRVKETYMIVNSNFTMEKDGSVNINLSIAQISGRLFVSIPFETSPELTDGIKKINNLIKKIMASLGVGSYKSTENVNLSMFDFDITNINEKSKKNIFSVIKKMLTNIDNMEKLVNNLGNPPQLDKINKEYQKLLESLIGSKDDTLQITSEVVDNIKSGSSRKLIKDLDLQITDSLAIKTKHSSHDADKFLKKIIPNIESAIDPFFDVILFEHLKKSNIKGIESTENYVTLGSVISGLIATHLPKEKRFTDIQLYSYTCNSNCGYMSNRNIFSILIRIKDLKEKIKEIIENNSQISLQEFITSVYVDLVYTEKNHSWGIFDIYKQMENQPDKSKPNIGFKKNLDLRLSKIYKEINKESYDNKIEFRLPFLQFVFNSKENKAGKMIFKVSFYDKQDDPFESLLKISSAINTKKIKSVIADFKNVKTSTLENVKTLKSNFPILSNDAFTIAAKGWLNYNKEIFIKKLFTEESIGNKTKLILKPEYNYTDLKKSVKTSMPSITYGTEASAVTSATLSSINDPGIASIKLAAAASSRKKDFKESKINANLPYHIFPTSVSVELIGCPFVNFNQSIFVDFQTGTIADNVYAATGIKHTITPGNFKTSLTLTPNDAYGYYETHIKGIEALLNSDLSNAEIEEVLKVEEVKEEVRKKKIEKANPNKTSTKAKKKKTSTKTGTTSPSSTAKPESKSTSTKAGSKLAPDVNCLVIALKAYGNETQGLHSSLYTRTGHTGLASTKQAKVAWKKYKKFVDASAAKHDIDASFLWGIMAVETGLGRPDALKEENDFGALGLMQFVRRTGKQYGLNITNGAADDERRDPAKIIEAAAKLLIDLQDPTKNKKHEKIYALVKKHFPAAAAAAGGKIPLQTAIAMYNSSPQRVLWGLEGRVKLRTKKTGPHAGKVRVITRTRTALKGKDLDGRDFTSRGPRLFPFDETFARYIHPLLTFKKHLDKCFAKHAIKEEAAKAIQAPPAVISQNEDDDETNPQAETRVESGEISQPLKKKDSSRDKEKKAKLSAKDKALVSKKEKVTNLGIDAVYLMAPAREFRIFALLCLSIPFFSKPPKGATTRDPRTNKIIPMKEIEDLLDVTYELDKKLKNKLLSLLKNLGKNNAESKIISLLKRNKNKKLEQYTEDNENVISFDSILSNLGKIEAYYKTSKKELNKNVTEENPKIVYNLINVGVPQSISLDSSEKNREMFVEYASLYTFFGPGSASYTVLGNYKDPIDTMCFLSKQFYERSSLASASSIVNFESDNESSFYFSFVRYFVSYMNYKLFESEYLDRYPSYAETKTGSKGSRPDPVNIINTGTKQPLVEFKNKFKTYDKSIQTNITGRFNEELYGAKNSYLGFDKINLHPNLQDLRSFYVTNVHYTASNLKSISPVLVSHIGNCIEKFNRNVIKDSGLKAEEHYKYLTASIVVPDLVSLNGFTQNKFKKYFDGKGILVKLTQWSHDKLYELNNLEKSVPESVLLSFEYFFRDLFIAKKILKPNLKTVAFVGGFLYNGKTNGTFTNDSVYFYLGTGTKKEKDNDEGFEVVKLFSNNKNVEEKETNRIFDKIVHENLVNKYNQKKKKERHPWLHDQ